MNRIFKQRINCSRRVRLNGSPSSLILLSQTSVFSKLELYRVVVKLSCGPVNFACARSLCLPHIWVIAVRAALSDMGRTMLLPPGEARERLDAAGMVPYLDRSLSRDRGRFLDFIADLEARGGLCRARGGAGSARCFQLHPCPQRMRERLLWRFCWRLQPSFSLLRRLQVDQLSSVE